MTEFTLHPRLAADTIEIGDLPICKVLLMNDQQFPWFILVPRRASITELYQLESNDLLKTQEESLLISQLIMQYFNGEKLNTGAIGNLVPQLHLHHIVRFHSDPIWPKPVWGNIEALPYNAAQIKSLKNDLQHLIKAKNNDFLST